MGGLSNRRISRFDVPSLGLPREPREGALTESLEYEILHRAETLKGIVLILGGNLDGDNYVGSEPGKRLFGHTYKVQHTARLVKCLGEGEK